MEKKIVAILTGPLTHLDHLAVLADYLDIPLIVKDETIHELAKTFYPKTKVTCKEPVDLSFEYLSSQFDIILQSGRYFSFELDTLMNSLSSKKVRFVYCPHGNSDKGHSFQKEKFPAQDISLVYGDHMLDLLRKSRVIEKTAATVITGNYRYPYYLENRPFYDDIVEKKFFSKLDPKKKTIFYAPTCFSTEYNSSFFSFCSELIEQNQNYNLIIKPHPFLESHFPAQTWHMIGKYEDSLNTVFIMDFPPIYPILSKVDIYIGDFSSIGYDFLAFDRPMFFFNTAISTDPDGRYLHRCGIEIPEEKRSDIYRFLEENMEKNEALSEIRKATYLYTFAPTVPSKALKKTLEELCS